MPSEIFFWFVGLPLTILCLIGIVYCLFKLMDWWAEKSAWRQFRREHAN